PHPSGYSHRVSLVPLTFPTRRSSDLPQSVRPSLREGERRPLVGRGQAEPGDHLAAVVVIRRVHHHAVRRPVRVARSAAERDVQGDRKSTRLNSSHEWISYAVFCLKKK